MPAQPQWLTRIPEILAELESLDTPVIDRATYRADVSGAAETRRPTNEFVRRLPGRPHLPGRTRPAPRAA